MPLNNWTRSRLVWPNWTPIIAILVIFLVGQLLEGYVLAPKLVGAVRARRQTTDDRRWTAERRKAIKLRSVVCRPWSVVRRFVEGDPNADP